MTLAVCWGPALQRMSPQMLAPVESALLSHSQSQAACNESRKGERGVEVQSCWCRQQQQPAEGAGPDMPHSTGTRAPAWSEMRPAQGRLRKVAMY